MQLSYDPKYNIAYIRLKEKTAEVETLHLGEDINVDIAPDGTVYGIELLNANSQLNGFKPGKCEIVNEQSGEIREVSLAL